MRQSVSLPSDHTLYLLMSVTMVYPRINKKISVQGYNFFVGRSTFSGFDTDCHQAPTCICLSVSAHEHTHTHLLLTHSKKHVCAGCQQLPTLQNNKQWACHVTIETTADWNVDHWPPFAGFFQTVSPTTELLETSKETITRSSVLFKFTGFWVSRQSSTFSNIYIDRNVINIIIRNNGTL